MQDLVQTTRGGRALSPPAVAQAATFLVASERFTLRSCPSWRRNRLEHALGNGLVVQVPDDAVLIVSPVVY